MPLIEHQGPPPQSCELSDRAEGGVCVAIPARDEEERIGHCLSALLGQTSAPAFGIFVLANNCSDATARIVREIGRQAAHDVWLCDIALGPSPTPAARARRLALNAAAATVGPRGVLLTTDGDTLVDPDWVGANLAEIAAGADVVCGAIAPDMSESLFFPEAVLQRGVLEFQYEQLSVELEGALDPLPADPRPFHRMESGASLAIRADILARVGGVPEIEPGEDRELVTMVRRIGGRVRHAPHVRVSTSCRLDGRARGGWADDLRERVYNPDWPCHPTLEAAAPLYRRVVLRAAFRAAWRDGLMRTGAEWAARLRIAPAIVERACAQTHVEAAWEIVERESPRLARARLSPRDLPREAARLQRLLARRDAGRAVLAPTV